jgi:glycerol-3-phosphate cytidylyltransferase
MKKKIIITYGTFDMFHIGHLNLLKRLKAMGDELIVGVSTDEFNLVKGKKTLIPYDQRAAIIAAIEYVDKVIPEDSWEQKVDNIKEFGVDIFVIGDDWQGKFDFLFEFCDVQYLKRTQGVSTTMLKDSLSAIKRISREDLINALDILERLRDDLA